MKQAQNGNVVKVHYTGKLTNGETFDSSVNREPLEFTMGQKQMIQGFEKAVLGMQVGESKTVNIPADEAYGQANPDMIFEIEKSQIPDNIPLEVGLQLNVQTNDGQNFPTMVKKIEGEMIVLDANHPLAGEELIFEIELTEIA
jgi:peptidylprolyl isomerase